MSPRGRKRNQNKQDMENDPIQMRREAEAQVAKTKTLRGIMFGLAAVAVALAGVLAYVWFQKSSLVNDLEAEKQDLDVDILLEVNVAEEETKFGFRLEETEDAVRAIAAFPRVHIRGFMTSAPDTETPEDNRKFFRKLSDLAVDTKSKNLDNVYVSALSMGMTNDYEVAVEEGASMIRVGTAIFGART